MQVAAKFLKTVQPSNNYLQHGDDLEHVYFRGQRRKKLQTSLLCTLMATRWICGMSSECAWSQNKCFWTLDASGCCVTDDKVNTGNIRCLETVLGDDSLPLGLVVDPPARASRPRAIFCFVSFLAQQDPQIQGHRRR
jgi:hypothetical protein